MSRVSLERVAKSYRDRRQETVPALADLTLAVEPGECLVLLGPSGCGKTTTLRLIAGLEEPDHGSIRIQGRDLAGVPPQDRDVAMVFQHFALYPHLRVRDNLSLGLKLRKLPATEVARRLAAMTDTLGLGPLLDRLPRELSGGERQRVALGRALIRQPAVLLLDEPFSNLDAPLRAELRSELAAVHRRTGATLLHVTHDQAEAIALAGRLAVLKDGRLQQLGPPESVYRRPANVFVAGFLGAPPMNLLRGRLQRDGGNVRFQPGHGHSPAWPLPASVAARLASCPEDDYVLGLRPEHFHPSGGSSVVTRPVVTRLEPLGSETLVTVRADDWSWILRMPPSPAPQLDDIIPLGVDWEASCWFDAGSGAAIPEGPLSQVS